MHFVFLLLLACASAAGAADSRPLNLEEALQIAEEHSARLLAQRAAIGAASEQLARAAELPDPKLRFGIDNLPVSDSDALSFTRDFMTMRRIGVMQDMPNAQKRQARGERALREWAVETGNLALQRAQLRQDTAIAWLELHYAQENTRALRELRSALQLEADTTGPAVSAGRMSAAAAVGARAAVETLRERLIVEQRNLERARAALAALIGDAAARAPAAPPDTSTLELPPQVLLEQIDRHPAQRIYEQREALAQAEVALAASARKPDWSWEVSFGQREPRYSNMVSLMVSMDLPLRKGARQDRDVAARVKQLEQAQALREDARRMHEAEVRALIADWRFAHERARLFATNVLPLTREKRDLALAAYRGGRGELATVLEAQRGVTEVELSRLNAERERARAWARLNFLLLAHGDH